MTRQISDDDYLKIQKNILAKRGYTSGELQKALHFQAKFYGRDTEDKEIFNNEYCTITLVCGWLVVHSRRGKYADHFYHQLKEVSVAITIPLSVLLPAYIAALKGK